MDAGELIIKTKIDNSGLKKDLKEAESLLEYWQKRRQQLEDSLKTTGESELYYEGHKKQLKEAEEQVSEYTLKVEKLKNELEGIQDIDVTPDNAQEIVPNVEKQTKGMSAISNFATRIASKFTGISVSALKFLGSITKLVGGLGLVGGLLGGIALAGTGLVTSISKAIEKNKQLKTQMEYLKFAMQSAFEGIGEALVKAIQWVINFIYKALILIGGLIKAITKKNIFKKSGIKDFEKSLKSTNKTAKSLQKTLAGFDEASVLNGGSGGLASGVLGDLPKLPDIADEVEKKAKSIREWFTHIPTKQELEKMFEITISPFVKVGEWLDKNFVFYIKKMIKDTEPYWKPLWEGLKKEFAPVMESIKLTWENFKKNLKIFAEPIFEPIKKAWKDTIDNYLKPMWNSFINLLPQPVKDFLNNMWEKFKKFYNDIAFYLNNLGIKIPYIVDKTTTTAEEGAKKVQKATSDASSQIDKLSKKTINIGVNTSSLNSLRNLLDDIILNIEAISGQKIKTRTWTTKANPKSAKGSIIYPKLAMGGIVSMPGRGVLYGGATIAERGAEAVLPLTDSQQMALLGEAIGKYITINANIVNTMNGRIISKELQRVQNDNDFAYNR